MEHKIAETNARIDVADVLRGLAVMGIILLHSIEHFNFYSFPEEVPFEWMKFTDQAIWRGLFFTFSNKAYAVFALLFGFSFYIQDNNQQRRGKDFRLRFLWRLFILFMIGQFNAAFFTGEILTMYAILGIILPIFCRMSDRTVVIFATLLILQPIDWVKLIYALCNPDYVAGKSLAGYYFSIPNKNNPGVCKIRPCSSAQVILASCPSHIFMRTVSRKVPFFCTSKAMLK